MPINMNCPSCAKALTAPENAAGKKAKCPACGQIMIVPEVVFAAEEFGDPGPEPVSHDYNLMGAFPGTTPWQSPADPTLPAPEPVRRPCPLCGEPIVATAAKCRFCGAVFDSRLRGSSMHGGQGFQGYAMPQGLPAERIKQIQNYFMAWWVCLAVGVGLCITCIGAVLGIPALIAGVVFHFMLLYQLWCTVQDGRAASTPGQAIGFLFIPFFNIYWQFVAIWGLAKELNRYSREHNIAAPEVNEGLALTVCILNCCSIIPYLGILTALAGMIIAIIEAKGMCDAAVAIIRSPHARAA
jgi:predicted RNA-binding Zn-ribbon protein involved in translation (DUF1610 family)